MTAPGRAARSTVDNAELALLLEVASTPKPGNVDRHRDYPDLRFEHFLAGAVGARDGLAAAARDDDHLGRAFETAIAGMSVQGGGNTQFGAVLLVAPLVRAASRDSLSPDGATAVVEETTVDDAVAFYGAFDHVDVAVGDPPADVTVPDVRRGRDAAAELRERDLTLADVMAESADVDGIAAEWTGGFTRTFEAADRIEMASGPVPDRAARVFLELLAAEVDTFVVTTHDRETAASVRDRAAAVLEREDEAVASDGAAAVGEAGVGADGEADAAAAVEAFADDLVAEGVNPGTTADLVAGGLFVALERGLEV